VPERSHEQIQRRLFDPIGKARDEQRLPSIVNRKSVLTFVMCGNAGLVSDCAVYSTGVFAGCFSTWVGDFAGLENIALEIANRQVMFD